MKKLRPADDSSKSFKINLVKVAGEDLHHVDEELPSVAEEVDEEDWEEEGDEEEADEVNGPECLWRDGEHGPEEDPEEWIGRVADEVEEKRLQKMQALERSEGSKEGISHLTTRNMYDWRKKRYHREAGTTSKRWKRRPRLIARECAFAEGKRDDISHQRLQDMYWSFYPQYSYRELVSKRGRRGKAFCQILGCLDVKDAVLQVPGSAGEANWRWTWEEKNSWWRESTWTKSWGKSMVWYVYLNKELEHKHALTSLQSTSPRDPITSSVLSVHGQEEMRRVWLTREGDLIFTGCSKYISEIFFPKIQDRFETSVSKIERVGDEFNVLRRNYRLEVDGLWIQPGNYIQQMLKAYEEQIGKIKLQQLPSDNSIQMEDKSEVMDDQERISLFRSIVGSGIYPMSRKVWCIVYSEGVNFKNGNPNNYGFSSLEEIVEIWRRLRTIV